MRGSSGGQRYDAESETLIAHTLLGKHNSSHAADQDTYITHSLRGEGFDASEDGTGRGTPLVPIGFAQNQRDEVRLMNVAGALAAEPGAKQQTYVAMTHAGDQANGRHQQAVAFQSSQSGVRIDDVHATLDSNNGPRRHNGALLGMQVRRLTPEECEALQAYPRGYTRVAWRGKPPEDCPDGPRYKALGNSWCTTNARWIGERIDRVNSILESA
ncbi:hypothetical protein AS148_25250 [Achromobacter xylosoxidans]|nr:hypothetical protein AS148_25250 [Achromobacter xylosoxidans]